MAVDVGSATGYLDLDINGFVQGLSEALRQSQQTEKKIEMAIPQRCQSNPRLSLMNHATNPFAHTWKTGRE